MADKLGRREFPAGLTPADFVYKGRPAKDQGDFGSDVGIADMACVDQFGEANTSKFYHGGVVQSKDGRWWFYSEWGRCKPGNSWAGSSFTGNAQDYQFMECSSEDEARTEFRKKMTSKNTKRLEQKVIAGATIWASAPGEDGYIVQKLATRDKGLPDAYAIKDNTGVATAPKPATPAVATATQKPVAKSAVRDFQPQVVSLARALVGGVQTYTRALSAASGVTPTMEAIEEVRNMLIPAAMQRLKDVGSDIRMQVQDSDLKDITKMVAAIVPRPIPRTGTTEESFVLNSNTIFVLQQDLDAFESALTNEDFSIQDQSVQPTYDPDGLLNARISWLDPQGEGAAIIARLQRMTNNRHGYLSGNVRVLNVFKVERPDRDSLFLANVKKVAAARNGQFQVRANLQPTSRQELTDEETRLYREANVIFTQHGTRSVNIAPITQTHFKLPRQLPGALICGANFGHGVYLATDLKKAVGYTSYERSAWGNGGGAIQGRGAFMFLCDALMGQAYVAPSTGSWNTPPNGCDSVFGRGGDRGHRLENDEHVVFDPHYTRIRYLVEFTF